MRTFIKNLLLTLCVSICLMTAAPAKALGLNGNTLICTKEIVAAAGITEEGARHLKVGWTIPVLKSSLDPGSSIWSVCREYIKAGGTLPVSKDVAAQVRAPVTEAPVATAAPAPVPAPEIVAAVPLPAPAASAAPAVAAPSSDEQIALTAGPPKPIRYGNWFTIMLGHLEDAGKWCLDIITIGYHWSLSHWLLLIGAAVGIAVLTFAGFFVYYNFIYEEPEYDAHVLAYHAFLKGEAEIDAAREAHSELIARSAQSRWVAPEEPIYDDDALDERHPPLTDASRTANHAAA